MVAELERLRRQHVVTSNSQVGGVPGSDGGIPSSGTSALGCGARQPLPRALSNVRHHLTG
jgi:hypothetical protein